MNRYLVPALSVGAIALTTAVPAFAVVDTTAVTAELAGMQTSVEQLGGLLLIAAGTIVAIKWAMAVLF